MSIRALDMAQQVGNEVVPYLERQQLRSHLLEVVAIRSKWSRGRSDDGCGFGQGQLGKVVGTQGVRRKQQRSNVTLSELCALLTADLLEHAKAFACQRNAAGGSGAAEGVHFPALSASSFQYLRAAAATPTARPVSVIG